MTRVRLRGIATATKRRSDGRKVVYHYAWRGGPRLKGVPGSAEYIESYRAAYASRQTGPVGTLAAVIAGYRASPDFKDLKPRTRADYGTYLDRIGDKFGTAPIGILSDKRMRGKIIEWRDSMAATPRKADLAVAVMARLLSFAVDRGIISTNVATKIAKLHDADRSERVWTDADLAKVEAVASQQVRDAVIMALRTCQRLGDLLTLTWAAFDEAEGLIYLKQAKTGAKVAIPASGPLLEVLTRLKAENDGRKVPSVTILTSARGTPWTVDGFKTAWQRAIDKAGMRESDLHFHDLRGTAITRLATAGATVPEIAALSGHSLTQVNSILERYLDRDPALARSAMRKLEENEARPKIANHSANRAVCSPQGGC